MVSIIPERVRMAIFDALTKDGMKPDAEIESAHRLESDLGMDSRDIGEMWCNLEIDLCIMVPVECYGSWAKGAQVKDVIAVTEKLCRLRSRKSTGMHCWWIRINLSLIPISAIKYRKLVHGRASCNFLGIYSVARKDYQK